MIAKSKQALKLLTKMTVHTNMDAAITALVKHLSETKAKGELKRFIKQIERTDLLNLRFYYFIF